jgi:two-component system, chemotaxis family, chemotaxis protein CheY
MATCMRPLILLIDDDEGIREFVNLALQDEGYSVLTAANGANALPIAREQPPQLILLDMRMPVMDGREFIGEYRRVPGPKAPIVVLTAARDAHDSAIQVEANGYLPKPFDLEELIKIVHSFLS